jgi:hypothetical protein
MWPEMKIMYGNITVKEALKELTKTLRIYQPRHKTEVSETRLED